MSKRMKIETTIANLKKMHESYKAEVERAQKEFVAIATKLNNYQNLVMRTEQSIVALEGGTAKMEPLNAAVGGVSGSAASTSLPTHLPPAEPGFTWEMNRLGEWVLIPETLGISNAQDENIPLVELPPILDDEEFVEKPEDFL